MEKLYKAVDDVVNYIKLSDEYKNCVSLKDKMSKNQELTLLIEKIKKVQKEHVKSNYDKNIKQELDKLNNKLEEIPVYNIYLENLKKVNLMIDYVRDELNDYFYKLFNE